MNSLSNSMLITFGESSRANAISHRHSSIPDRTCTLQDLVQLSSIGWCGRKVPWSHQSVPEGSESPGNRTTNKKELEIEHRQLKWNLPEDHFDLYWFDEGWGGLHWLLSPVSMLLPLLPGEFPIHPVVVSTQNIICQWRQIVHLVPYLNVHENNSTSSRVLIVNKSLGMFSFLKRSFLEVLVESRKGNIVTIEKGCHRQVHIRGVQFKIDLFVDSSLTINMEVLASLRCRHSVHLLDFLITDNNCVVC